MSFSATHPSKLTAIVMGKVNLSNESLHYEALT